VRQGVRALKASSPARPVDPALLRPSTIEVSVVTTPSVGGVLIETRGSVRAKALGSFRCRFFDLPGENPEEGIEARAAALEPRPLAAIHLVGFADALGDLLHKHLKRRFRHVKVRAVSRLEAKSGVVVTPQVELYEHVWWSSPKRSFVWLRADGATGEGHGREHASRGHLVWAVPTAFVSLATLPAGAPSLVATHLVLRSLESDAIALSVAKALDAATRDLAVKLAERPDHPVVLELRGTGP